MPSLPVSSRRPRVWLLALLLPLALVGFASCQRSDPLEIKVQPDPTAGLNPWRLRVGTELSPDQWRDFDDAIREIKLQIMATGEATGSVGVEQAFQLKLRDQTVREVLRTGFDARLRRLEAERHGLTQAIEQNSRLETRPGDTESADYLTLVRSRQATHLQTLEHDLADAELKLKQLGFTSIPVPAVGHNP
jgi:hypothetical protein